jgi:hypothetical protein
MCELTQVYRIIHWVSKCLAATEEEVLYVGIDGLMVSTREEGWKEIKIARLSAVTVWIPI